MNYFSPLEEQELNSLSLQLCDLITTLARSAVGNPPYDKLDRIFQQFVEGHKIADYCKQQGCPLYLTAALIAYVESRKQVEVELENGKLAWKAEPEVADEDWLHDNYAVELTGERREGISCFKNADSLTSYCGFSPKFGFHKGNQSLNLIIRRAKLGDVRQFLYYLYQKWSE